MPSLEHQQEAIEAEKCHANHEGAVAVLLCVDEVQAPEVDAAAAASMQHTTLAVVATVVATI